MSQSLHRIFCDEDKLLLTCEGQFDSMCFQECVFLCQNISLEWIQCTFFQDWKWIFIFFFLAVEKNLSANRSSDQEFPVLFIEKRSKKFQC